MRKLRHLIGLLVASISLGLGGSMALTSVADAGTITVGPITITLPGPTGKPAPATTTGLDFSASAYSVDENARDAVITVVRGGNSLPAATVHYHTPPLALQTALAVVDYTPVNGLLSFAAGQSAASFAVPIVDLGVPGLPPVDFYVELYGATGTPLGSTTTARVTINDTDANALSKIVGNPLGLTSGTATAAGTASTSTSTSAPTPALVSNPLSGVQFFIDHQWGTAAVAARRYPQDAAKLNVIADEPIAMRFVASNTTHGADLAASRFIQRAKAAEPGTVPEISTYALNHRGSCDSSYRGPGYGHYTDNPTQLAGYENWVRSLAAGISSSRAVVYLEIDGLITTPCLSQLGLHRRILELRYAIAQLSALPRTAVYVDAGAADALTSRQAAALLNQIGVSKIQGFFLNATHYDWTSNELKYGYAISRLTHGAHFVVNTAVNGRGPLVPRDRVAAGNEVRCNPAGRGLGPKPTTHTGYKNVDAFAWIGNPGLSTGTCGNAKVNPPTGVFDLSYALSLVKYADFKIR